MAPQPNLAKIRYLTGGSDTAYVLSAGRADVGRLRKVPLTDGASS